MTRLNLQMMISEPFSDILRLKHACILVTESNMHINYLDQRKNANMPRCNLGPITPHFCKVGVYSP